MQKYKRLKSTKSEIPFLVDSYYRLRPELRGRFRAVSCYSPSVISNKTTYRNRPKAVIPGTMKTPLKAGLYQVDTLITIGCC